MPSVQLSEYLQLRADGVSVEDAAERSRIGSPKRGCTKTTLRAATCRCRLPHVHVHPRARGKTNQGRGWNMPNGTVAADELRLLIERIERVKEEIKGLNDDVRDIYAEAKSRGFDTPAMKSVIKLRKMEPHTRRKRKRCCSSTWTRSAWCRAKPRSRLRRERAAGFRASPPTNERQHHGCRSSGAEGTRPGYVTINGHARAFTPGQDPALRGSDPA
jgi:uncharacterized protein (UPF0335 family)